MTSGGSDAVTGASEPELVTVERATTTVVRGVVPMGELPSFFDSSFRTILEIISAQGVGIVSPALGLYYGPPGETADLEVGFVTDSAVRPQGEVVASSLPSGRVARLVHVGAFDGLGPSWERLWSWMDEQGLAPGPVMWEVYVTEPSPDMDPRELRTELNWPVAD